MTSIMSITKCSSMSGSLINKTALICGLIGCFMSELFDVNCSIIKMLANVSQSKWKKFLKCIEHWMFCNNILTYDLNFSYMNQLRMCNLKFSFLLVISNHSPDCCLNCTPALLHFNLLCFRARNEGLTNAALCACSVLGSHTVLWDKGIYLTSRYDFDTTLLRRWNLKNRRLQRFLRLAGWALMIKFLTDL